MAAVPAVVSRSANRVECHGLRIMVRPVSANWCAMIPSRHDVKAREEDEVLDYIVEIKISGIGSRDSCSKLGLELIS